MAKGFYKDKKTDSDDKAIASNSNNWLIHSAKMVASDGFEATNVYVEFGDDFQKVFLDAIVQQLEKGKRNGILEKRYAELLKGTPDMVLKLLLEAGKIGISENIYDENRA